MASLGPVVPGGSQLFGTHYKGGMPGLPSQRQLLMGSPLPKLYPADCGRQSPGTGAAAEGCPTSSRDHYASDISSTLTGM